MRPVASHEIFPTAFRSITFTILCLCALTPSVFAQDNWLGGTGNWSNGAKWSAGVPGSSSDVFIDHSKAGASPVTLDVGGQANTLTIDSDDSLSFSNNQSLVINGNSVSNAGTISLNSAGNLTTLFIANGATLSGAGTLTMGNNSQNQVDGNSGAVLTNQSTIQGVGQIGPHFLMANQGTVNANVTGATLNLMQQSSGTDTNSATMEATNGGILAISTGGSSSLNNTGGTIKAVGANSQVQFENGTTITGGTLTTSNGGLLVLNAGAGLNLSGVTNSGTFSILNNASALLSGTITNTGTFQLNSGGSLTLLFVPTAATLTGAGTVTMGNNSQNEVDGNSGATLTIKQTIQGVGNIGPHFLFSNQGTINANVKGAILNVLQQSSGTDTNTAVMEATNGGILQISTGGSSSINNTGGTIEAIGTGSVVQFENGTTITGGTLTTSSGGMLAVLAGAGVFENGVTNAGAFTVQNNGSLYLQSDLTNNGTISLNSAGNLTYLFLPTVSASLLGKGRVIMDNNVNSAIDGNGGLTFTNHSTIQGGGTIGPHFTFTNLGTLKVPKGDALFITAPFTNFNGSTVIGGTYTVSGTLEFTNASIVTNSAKITLTGSTAQIVNQSAVNALANLSSNVSSGSFTSSGGQQYATTLSGSFSNAGKLMVGKNSGFKILCNPTFQCPYTQTGSMTTVDGTLTAAFGVNINGGKLFGTGTVASSVNSKASVTAGDTASKAGTLSVSTYTQQSAGSLNIQLGGTTVGTQYSQLAVANGASLNGTLNVNLINGFIPTIGDVYTILTSSARTGTFSTVNLPALSGAHFVINYSSTSVTLTVVSG
ncbi:MAG TPA: hypothetical protein VNW47_09005 [Terriglobales bacterium]|jgi:hypothetical protein|nr:hypothetical protein [Terriglobales bacterium]